MERHIILGQIEKLCGPPTSTASRHWNSYKDPVTHKKSKGGAISDLEKARGDPPKYKVTGKAAPGQMRPPRPPPPLFNRVGATPSPLVHQTDSRASADMDNAPARGKQLDALVVQTSHDDDDAYPDMKSAQELSQENARLKAQLDEQLRKEAEKKERLKRQRDEAKEAKAAAAKKKKDAAAAAKAQKAAAEKAQKDADRPPLTPYEQDRADTIAKNNQYLKLVEETTNGKLVILEFDECLSLLGRVFNRCAR